MGIPLFCLLMQLTGLSVRSGYAKMLWREDPFNDDFVEVDFEGCTDCEKPYRDLVLILVPEEEGKAAPPIYHVAVVMWLILAALVIFQRWRQMIYKR